MSWHFKAIGTPAKLAERLEKETENHHGQCLVEYNDAKPHLLGLLSQVFLADASVQPLIDLEASGSGYSKDGKQADRSISVSLKQIHGFVG